MSTNNVSLSFFNQITQADKQKQAQKNFDNFSNNTTNVFENNDAFVNSNSMDEIAEEFWAINDEINAYAEDIADFTPEEFAQVSQSYEYQDTYDKLNTLDSVFQWFD